MVLFFSRLKHVNRFNIYSPRVTISHRTTPKDQLQMIPKTQQVEGYTLILS